MTDASNPNPTISPAPQLHNFSFTGKGGEYFRIWIVNSVLSVITLGIYSAWATVRTHRYFYGNTLLNNASFEYHATPQQILKGRIIALIALAIYILVASFLPIVGFVIAVIGFFLFPWVVWSSLRFKALMSSYRNVRFSFTGSLKDSYLTLLIWPALAGIIGLIISGIVYFVYPEAQDLETFLGLFVIVTGIALFLITPYLQKIYTSYYLNHMHYGQGNFQAKLTTKAYYWIYTKFLLWWLLLLLLVGGFLYWLFFAMGGDAVLLDIFLMFAGVMGAVETQDDLVVILGVLAFLFYIFIILAGIWSTAFLNKNMRNYAYNLTQLDQMIQFKSNTSVGKLFGIYLLNAVLLVLTVGFAHPWNKVRVARYEANTLSIAVNGQLEHYVSQLQEKQSSLGDQLSDVFDIPVDIGLNL